MRCTHDLDTHVSNLVPRVFGLSGQQGWHCHTDQKPEDSGYKIGTCPSRSQIVCVPLSRGRGNGVADQKDRGLWERYCASVYSSFYFWTVLPCSVCRRIYSLEQCPRGKSRVILEVKEVKQSTKKKKKLKTSSHTRKNRAKKMMLHFPDEMVE